MRYIWHTLIIVACATHALFPSFAHADACDDIRKNVPVLQEPRPPTSLEIGASRIHHEQMRLEYSAYFLKYSDERALLEDIASTLQPHTTEDARGWDFRFHVLPYRVAREDAKVAANGVITLAAEVLYVVPSVDMLATIIAHEEGHIVLRHLDRENNRNQLLAKEYMQLAYARAAATSPEERASLDERALSILNVLISDGELRTTLEREADIYGAHIANRAGYALSHVADFIQAIRNAKGDSSGATHPPRSEREAILRCFPDPNTNTHNDLNDRLRALQERAKQRGEMPKTPFTL